MVRIAQARWVAIALAVVVAFMVRGQVAGAPWTLLGAASVAAAYNTMVVFHRRLSWVQPRPLAATTVLGDFVWVTLSAALATGGGGAMGAGYVVVALESGLLLGWAGAIASLVAAVAVGLGLDLTVLGTGSFDPGALVVQLGTVAVASGLAGVASSELRTQRLRLSTQAATLGRHARSDHLTGLNNWWALREAAQHIAGQPYALLLVDIDGTRWINTLYGHLAGDELLHGISGVLATIQHPGATPARLREDKFVMLLPGANEASAARVGEQIRDATHGIPVSAGQLRVSIGCAMARPGDDVNAVLARADEAVFAAKGAGGDRVVVHGGQAGARRWSVPDAVNEILADSHSMYSVYQPIVQLTNAQTVGWEALSRPREWPSDSSVEALFLTAHRMGRGRDLDWRCRRNALWEASRLDGPLFLNVNIGTILDPVHGADQMELVCEWARRAPGDVVLELSERDAVPDPKRLREALAEYRRAGFRIALDDVGEGQTTMELVLAARPEFLKLARQLIQAAHLDVTTRTFTRGLVALAHDIGSIVVAEGLETEADRELCMSLGMDLGQGWLFGRPQPPEMLGKPPLARGEIP